MSRMVQRYFFFVLGSLLNAFGVAFITKGALGTSQISSIPYVFSLKFTSLSFGTWVFIFNLLLIAIQIVLLRKNFKPAEFLQLVANLLFSYFIDLCMAMLFFLNPATLPTRFVSLLVGCCILAFGVCVEMAPNVVAVSGEAVVRVIANISKKPFGTVKMIFDITLIALACVFSFLFFGRLNGVGIGTLICALLVGQIVNVFNKKFTFLQKIRDLAQPQLVLADEEESFSEESI